MKRVLFPHPVIVATAVPSAALLLIYSFTHENAPYAVKYFSYFFSAYALILLCVRIPDTVKYIKKLKQENKYAGRYFSDPELRVKLSLYGSFGINSFYAFIQLISGLANRSAWFYALSVYYFTLALMRFFLLFEARKNSMGKNIKRELIKYRQCGAVLLFMNIVLSVMTFYIVWQGRVFSYSFIMTIAMAAYTFLIFTLSIVNMVRYKKYNSPIMSAAKQISFAASLVSMLTLESAMLTAFGENASPEFARLMTALTGGAVCTAILVLAVIMIAYSTKRIKEYANG